MWDKALALYISGKTYTQIAAETGISYSQLTKAGSRDRWSEKRKICESNTKAKTVEKIADKSAAQCVKVLAPARAASERMLNKIAELTEACDNARDARALSSAIKDITIVIRELNGILTRPEEEQLAQARERIQLERERIEANAHNETAADIKVIIEGDYDGD